MKRTIELDNYNPQQICVFTNMYEQDLVCKWAGKERIVKAGESLPCPMYLALHFGRKLAEKKFGPETPKMLQTKIDFINESVSAYHTKEEIESELDQTLLDAKHNMATKEQMREMFKDTKKVEKKEVVKVEENVFEELKQKVELKNENTQKKDTQKSK